MNKQPNPNDRSIVMPITEADLIAGQFVAEAVLADSELGLQEASLLHSSYLNLIAKVGEDSAYCAICEAEATHFVVRSATPLCSTCHTAYEMGQENFDGTTQPIENLMLVDPDEESNHE